MKLVQVSTEQSTYHTLRSCGGQLADVFSDDSDVNQYSHTDSQVQAKSHSTGDS